MGIYMVVIYTAYSHADALTINSLLNASGVDSVLLDYNHAVLQSHLILAIGIRVGVPEEQKDLATEVIEEYIKKKRTRPPFNRAQPAENFEGTCPQCGSGNIRIEGYPRKFPSIILGLILMLPLVIRRKVYRCQDCGAFWKRKSQNA